MRTLDIIFGAVILFCALSVALYILPTIKNQEVAQINAVLNINLPETIRFHLLPGQQIYDNNHRPVGMITSIYPVKLNDGENEFITWRINSTMTAAKNDEQLSIAEVPLLLGTRLRFFTYDTEFYGQFIEF